LSRILALLREDLGSGFSLAGVDVSPVADAAALRTALDAAIGAGLYGMVVVEEELMRELPDDARKGYAAVTVPLVIEVPGAMEWREAQGPPPDDYVARLIRRAVGYQLNIKL
jgi:vacuolar-type H+-ATPase subunit F/Vma7